MNNEEFPCKNCICLAMCKVRYNSYNATTLIGNLYWSCNIFKDYYTRDCNRYTGKSKEIYIKDFGLVVNAFNRLL